MFPNEICIYVSKKDTSSKQLDTYKLHKHSHLYTKDTLIDFPGRRFKVENIVPYNKKELRKTNISKANITTRNFPETVLKIRKKHKISDGGNIYLFFTITTEQKRIVIVASKV